MKKSLVSLLCALLLVGCSSGSVAKATAASTNSATTQTSETTDSISAEEDLTTVTIHIPASLLEGSDTSDAEESAKEKGIDKVIKNDDGSIDYVMSKKVHRQMMSEMKDSFVKQMTEFLSDKETYPSFEDITYNDDLSEFTISCSSQELTLDENLVSYSLMLMSLFYQTYNLVPEDQLLATINYKDKDSGEIFSTTNSKKLGDEQ